VQPSNGRDIPSSLLVAILCRHALKYDEFQEPRTFHNLSSQIWPFKLLAKSLCIMNDEAQTQRNNGTHCGVRFEEFVSGKKADATMKALSRIIHLTVEWTSVDKTPEGID
jgi:hypothetical protein